MERRSDKYNTFEKAPERNSRVEKNRLLYDEMNSKIGYEDITNYEANTHIDLSSLNVKTPNREDYHKIKEYKDILATDFSEEKKEKVEVEYKPKTFDINQVLEEAKKNRKNVDELEKRRNLNDQEYSVLSTLNKKYLHKKDFDEEDSEELKELIDTITSKTLRDEIKDEEEKELLSELLATTIDVKLESELSEEEIRTLYANHKSSDSETDDDEEMENSFYTKTLELSKDDLLSDDEEEEEEEVKGGNGLKIFIVVLLLIGVLVIVSYFILKHFGIMFN